MKTPTTIAHHPLHPILVSFPIALWIFALAADIVALGDFGPADVWNNIAFYSILAGCVGAILAAIPGMIDLLWLSDNKLKATGIRHAILAVGALILFAIDWFWRLSSPATMTGPFVLAVIGVIVLGVAGWIGGDLVHGHRVSVEEPPTPPAHPVQP